jgi:hypothetical protein
MSMVKSKKMWKCCTNPYIYSVPLAPRFNKYWVTASRFEPNWAAKQIIISELDGGSGYLRGSWAFLSCTNGWRWILLLRFCPWSVCCHHECSTTFPMISKLWLFRLSWLVIKEVSPRTCLSISMAIFAGK